MVRLTRSTGYDPGKGSFTAAALTAEAVWGQAIQVQTVQTQQLIMNQESHDNLNLTQLGDLAYYLNSAIKAQTDYIGFAWDEVPGPAIYDTASYVIYNFSCKIIVEPLADPVTAQMILNGLAGSILEKLNDTAFFSSTAGIAGSPDLDTQPGPYAPKPGFDTKKILEWINPPTDASVNYVAPQAMGIVHRGVITGFQDEDRFSPVNSFAYSPLTQTMTDFQNVALVGILAALARTPDGRDKIFKLADTYIKSTTKLLETIVESGKTHPLTALNASTAYAATAHRLGILTDSGYLKMADQTRSIIDKLLLLDFAGMALDGISTFTDKAITVASMAKKY